VLRCVCIDGSRIRLTNSLLALLMCTNLLVNMQFADYEYSDDT
jgi:hypothetical protein